MSFGSRITPLVLGVTLSLVGWAPAIPQEQVPEASGPPHESALTVGELPPAGFTLPSIDGRTYELEALRGRQALMIVFFRGTW